MGKKTRIQHYVPQLYLRNFTKEKNTSISVYDKKKKIVEQRNIEKIPAENYFYDIEIENIRNFVSSEKIENEILEMFKTQFIEKNFSEIENRYKIFLDKVFEKIKMAQKMQPIFSESEIEEFSFYMISQHLRTKSMREKLVDVEAEFFNKYVDKTMELDIILDEYNKDEKTLKHAVFMLDFNRTCNFIDILKKHIWIIGKNETSQKLLTSDNPLVRKASYKEWLNGLGAEGIRIGFPLNSKYILMMYDKKYFKQLLPYHNTVQGLKTEGVLDFNRMQIEQSDRYIFGEDEDLSFVSEVLKNT